MNCTAKVISPLEKVFYDDKMSSFKSYPKSSALIGEKHNFCIAYMNTDFSECRYTSASIYLTVKSDIKKHVSLCTVEHVPAVYAANFDEKEDGMLRKYPGLYPDVKKPVKEKEIIKLLPKLLNSLWVEVDTTDVASGNHKIKIEFHAENGNLLCECEHTVKVIGAKLPEQKLMITHWFHTDCLADYYKVKVFSQNHWKAIKNAMITYANAGNNIIYTPLFTPPLDTNVGGERTTVQLVDVALENGKYIFDFSKLHRWVKICKDAGIKYFEMNHLFTQWGAFHAPKIMATVDGKKKKIFGWETDAHGAEYEDFLSQFLPALLEQLKLLDLEDCTLFHISDEPSLEHLESYKACSDIIRKYLKGYKIMDAMFNPEFYTNGYVDIPIPYIKHADTFFPLNPDPKFVYYCGIDTECMGRALAMHSCRTRISGIQFYAHKIDGFLHWGHNFYNSCKSLRHIDPYAVTDADKQFGAGDNFMVYPGDNFESFESVRLAVFRDGLQDKRALELCEALCGAEAVNNAIAELNEGKPLDLGKTPTDKDFAIKLREKINSMIEAAI